MADDKNKKKKVDQLEGERGQEDQLFKIDDTPENVAKALFSVNPNKEGFEWEYLKSGETKSDDRDSTGINE